MLPLHAQRASKCVASHPPRRREEFERKRIPGSLFFDLGISVKGPLGSTQVHDNESGETLVHALPSAPFFGELMRELGIRSDTTVVVYDSMGVWSSPRAWWLLRVFGHARAAVLDGGLPAWVSAGQPIESGPPSPPTSVPESESFVSEVNEHMICTGRQLVHTTTRIHVPRCACACTSPASSPSPLVMATSNLTALDPGVFLITLPGVDQGTLGSDGFHVIDARDSEVFWLLSLIDSTSGKLRSRAHIRRAFSKAGMPSEGALSIKCTSGLTASVLALAIELLGRDVKLYDNSGSRQRRLEIQARAGASQCFVEPACSSEFSGSGRESGRGERQRFLSECSEADVATHCVVSSMSSEEISAWVGEWGHRVDEWSLRLPLAHTTSLRNCLGGMGLHLASHLESAAAKDLSRSSAQWQASALLVPTQIAQRECDGLHKLVSQARRERGRKHIELSAEFRLHNVLPLLPRVLPDKWHINRGGLLTAEAFFVHLESLQVTSSRQTETKASAATMGSLLLGAGGAAAVIALTGLLTLRWRRPPSTIRLVSGMAPREIDLRCEACQIQ